MLHILSTSGALEGRVVVTGGSSRLTSVSQNKTPAEGRSFRLRAVSHDTLFAKSTLIVARHFELVEKSSRSFDKSQDDRQATFLPSLQLSSP